jgi:hypothetical protein
VLFKTVRQFSFEAADLGGELDNDGHQRLGGGAHGVGDHGRGLELWGAEHGLDLGGSFLDPPLAAGPAQTSRDLGLREAAAERWGRGHVQNSEGVSRSELVEGRQGRRVELAQGGPELVQLPLPAPDHALVRSGQHLYDLGEVAVPGDGPVIVAIGPGQFGQNPGVAGVGLRPRRGVALPIARGRHRVHGQHGVPRRHHRTDKQSPVRFSGDHHL